MPHLAPCSSRRSTPSITRHIPSVQDLPGRFQHQSARDMDREIGVFGDPGYCVERIRALREEYGFDEFIGYFNQGGLMDPELVRATMKLFAEAVMPLLR